MLLTPEIIFKQVESITPDYLQKKRHHGACAGC